MKMAQKQETIAAFPIKARPVTSNWDNCQIDENVNDDHWRNRLWRGCQRIRTMMIIVTNDENHQRRNIKGILGHERFDTGEADAQRSAAVKLLYSRNQKVTKI